MSSTISRRGMLQTISGVLASAAVLSSSEASSDERPNIILCMADDLGWGDVGCNGHPHIQTPHLDDMAREGIRFTRFYSSSPVCSPTRASCLTGRHPYRQGIFGANTGHMKREELTLAEALKAHGYTTGHFGKWHLGTLTTTINDSNRGKPGVTDHYAPPWEHGFDECFSSEAKTPTYDPMITPTHGNWGAAPGEPFGTYYWTGPEARATENLDGDDSRVIMDRAIPFIREAVSDAKPFFTVIWFHTPHSPVVAGRDHRDLYAGFDENKQHYYGCVTAMDEQMGRLRDELKDLGVRDNTMLWFCSDNGAAGVGGGVNQQPGRRQQGTSGPFRGRKGSLYEGGIRVPGLLEWPKRFPEARTIDFPATTLDYFPTIADALDLALDEQPRPIDGISLLPALEGKQKKRNAPFATEHREQRVLIDDQFKIYSGDGGESFEMYDLYNDYAETTDVSSEHPEVFIKMKAELEAWRASCMRSQSGADY